MDTKMPRYSTRSRFLTHKKGYSYVKGNTATVKFSPKGRLFKARVFKIGHSYYAIFPRTK